MRQNKLDLQQAPALESLGVDSLVASRWREHRDSRTNGNYNYLNHPAANTADPVKQERLVSGKRVGPNPQETSHALKNEMKRERPGGLGRRLFGLR